MTFKCAKSCNRVASLVLFLVVPLLAFLFVVRLTYWDWEAAHAKSCLRTIADIADRVIEDDIPSRNYLKAVKAAVYIEEYYPVGTVLPETHPYSRIYEIERAKQLNRIALGLTRASNEAFGTDWSSWESFFKARNIDTEGVPKKPVNDAAPDADGSTDGQ